MLGYGPQRMTGNGAHFVSDRNHVSFNWDSDNEGEVCGNSSLKSSDSLGKCRWIGGNVGHKIVGKAWLLRKRNTPPWQSHVFSRHAGHKLCNYVNVSENNWYCCLACSCKLVDMLKPSGLANMEPNQI